MRVEFKPYIIKNLSGNLVPMESVSKGFYSLSMMMPKKTPISFVTAMELVWENIDHLNDSNRHKDAMLFLQKTDWVKFISDQGFHVEYTGEEFYVVDQLAA